MIAQVQRTLDSLRTDIAPQRKEVLARIGEWVKERGQNNRPAHLVFICTHNSRRSQFAQAWTAAQAHGFALLHVHAWSAGTEASAVAPPVVDELEMAGFLVEDRGEETEEVILSYAEDAEVLVLHSKRIDDPENPANDFAAIMVCGEADEACPFVPGAVVRFALPYSDPKNSDGTDQQRANYRACSEAIAAEMRYALEHAAR